MSVSIRNIVGQLELVERYTGSVHPLLPCGRAVRVYVGSTGQFRIRFARNHPPTVVKLVPVGKKNMFYFDKCLIRF